VSELGLRERKRQRTHDAISAAAITLFLAHGFDQVSVADIAAAAEVSKPTLFKYFPSKEDLVLHRVADHQGEAARVVGGRSSRQSPLAALRRHFLRGLAERDPVTGLNDHPEVLAYHRMVFATPSLAQGVLRFAEADEVALAEALSESGPPATARLAAAQIVAVQRVLARENWAQLTAGRPADEVEPEAVRAAERGFTLLRSGLSPYDKT
jgi:AcrR family transcriptional regulator